jgi:hypothetical protein
MSSGCCLSRRRPGYELLFGERRNLLDLPETRVYMQRRAELRRKLSLADQVFLFGTTYITGVRARDQVFHPYFLTTRRP